MAVQTTVQIRGEDKTAAAFRSVNNRAKNLERSFSGLSASVSGLATSFAGLLGVGALGSFSKDLISLGDRLQKVSIQTGIAVEELEILQFAASQAGVGTDQLNAAVQKFSINVGKAEDGTKLQADAFEALGISLKDASGNLKGQSTLFVEVADAIAGIEEPAVKARLASDLFGRTGVELLALLNLGAVGIADYGETLREAGGIIGKTASDDFSAFNDQMDLLNRSLRGKFVPTLVAVLPALTALAENSKLKIKSVNINPTRTGVIKILKKMGIKIKILNKKIYKGENLADIEINSIKFLKPINCPVKLNSAAIDEFLLIFLCAAKANGISYFKNLSELNEKESPRLKWGSKILNKMGIKNITTKDSIKIYGNPYLKIKRKIVIKDYLKDHRVFMTSVIAALTFGGKWIIHDKGVEKTSFPSFLNKIAYLGANITR